MGKKERERQQETTRTRTSASARDRQTDRIETEEFARVGRRRKTRIMATWKDKLRRQGTAFPAWGQYDPNALKRPLDEKLDNPRYESVHRMGGSENQPQWKKNLRYEGSAFVPWGAPDPYDHFFEDSLDKHEGLRAPLAPKEGIFGVKTNYVSAFPRRSAYGN